MVAVVMAGQGYLLREKVYQCGQYANGMLLVQAMLSSTMQSEIM